jgi:hypothetical protein
VATSIDTGSTDDSEIITLELELEHEVTSPTPLKTISKSPPMAYLDASIQGYLRIRRTIQKSA